MTFLLCGRSEALSRRVAPAAGVFERLSQGSRAGVQPAAVSGQNGVRVSVLDTMEGAAAP